MKTLLSNFMRFPLYPILQLLMLPIGMQLSGSSQRIKHKNNETAVLGGNVTMFCNLTVPGDVMQITWQKIQGSTSRNIGTYSSTYGEKILPPYIHRLHCNAIEPNFSFITIHEVTFEDEGCYKCVFNVFPSGSQGGQICLYILTVSELRAILQPNLSSGDFVRLIYSAEGKPAPQISLSPPEVLSNPPEEYLAQNPNGTVTVTKTYNISLETVRSLSLQRLVVQMEHPLKNEVKYIPLSDKQKERSNSGHFRLYYTSVLSIASITVLCIVCYVKIQTKKE